MTRSWTRVPTNPGPNVSLLPGAAVNIQVSAGQGGSFWQLTQRSHRALETQPAWQAICSVGTLITGVKVSAMSFTEPSTVVGMGATHCGVESHSMQRCRRIEAPAEGRG